MELGNVQFPDNLGKPLAPMAALAAVFVHHLMYTKHLLCLFPSVSSSTKAHNGCLLESNKTFFLII